MIFGQNYLIISGENVFLGTFHSSFENGLYRFKCVSQLHGVSSLNYAGVCYEGPCIGTVHGLDIFPGEAWATLRVDSAFECVADLPAVGF